MTPETQTSTRSQWQTWDEEALLIGMLAIFTASGAEQPLAEWLCEQARPLGFNVTVDAVGNFIGILPATVATPEPPCVLLGHMDTVAGEIAVRCEGDYLYGRGAVDAKGPLATFLAATARVAASDMPRRRDIIVVGAVEEEAATSRGARAILDRWRPAFTIIGEPSGADAVTLGYKGRLLVTYRAEQPVAHTARPEDSVCARGVTYWQTVQQQAANWNAEHALTNGTTPQFAALTPSLRAMQSGSDGFTDWCVLEIGYRLPPDFDIAALQHWLAAEAVTAGGRAIFRGAEAAYRGPRSGPLVSAFVRALRAESLSPAFKFKTGTSDMNVVGPSWNCPILAYGPGDAALDHTPNEHIRLSEYHQGIAVLHRVLTELATERTATA